jgi:acyl transferase domain-containing protein
VIRGSAINNDGGQKMSYMATKAEGQVACMQAAFDDARVDPDTVSYIEAHGTGTAMGDQVEMIALNRVFRSAGSAVGGCAIGVVKNNIGHLDIAAGIASLIKVVLCLRNAAIPPCANFVRPNPKLNLEGSPFRFPSVLEPWTSDTQLRRAAINCLGIGGTNAFVVLEEAPARLPVECVPAGDQLFVLAAKTEAALSRKAKELASWLSQYDGPLDDVAYTLAVGRAAMPWRLSVVAADREELVRTLVELPKKHGANASTGYDNGRHAGSGRVRAVSSGGKRRDPGAATSATCRAGRFVLPWDTDTARQSVRRSPVPSCASAALSVRADPVCGPEPSGADPADAKSGGRAAASLGSPQCFGSGWTRVRRAV